MKINIIKTALKRHLRYSCSFFILLIAFGTQAQTIAKTFTKELAIPDYTTMVSKGPYSMGFKMNGRIDLNSGGEKFTITPGSNDGIAALIIDGYQIFTWDKKMVRQTLEISIEADKNTPNDAQQLMDHLKMNLQLDANNKVLIDDNMNIKSFGFVNGWFTSNKSFIILDNGKKYAIKSINIKASLHIPKKSNLELTSKYIPISIGDIEGQLHVNINNARLSVGNVEQLEASLYFSKAAFQSITNAKINGVNSEIKTGCITNVLVGSDYYSPKNTSDVNLIGGDKQYSYSTNYNFDEVKNLTIATTTSDQFNIGKINSLTSLHSTFTDYTIAELTEKLLLSAKNGNLRINSVAKTFQSIVLDNNISSIYLNMIANPNYSLQLLPNKYTEYDLPKGLTHHSKKDEWEGEHTKGDKEKGGTIEIRCHDCTVEIND